MDKRSVGSFIAALRRAKGMTQKDLAALLHVSDKTVSRWETGEGAPELALIPAIAEIFGVSCDELLRGERKSEADAAESTPLGEKRRKWLLDSALRRFNIYCIIASGVSLIAVAAGLILQFVPAYTHRQIVVTSVICAVALAAAALIFLAVNGYLQSRDFFGKRE